MHVPPVLGRPVLIVGNYGSGKTEAAVHLALPWAAAGAAVSIADFDLVNPYFRCREVRLRMESEGIHVVVPPPALEHADLPIVLPEIAGLLRPGQERCVIFDVGGDDVGARPLASLRCALADAPVELWQVINGRRPFTSTVDGCLLMKASIERAARLEVTGLIANTHLMEQTTKDVVLEGVRLAREVARQGNVPLRAVAVPAGMELAIDVPLLPLDPIMLPPWLRPKGKRQEGEVRLGSHHD